MSNGMKIREMCRSGIRIERQETPVDVSTDLGYVAIKKCARSVISDAVVRKPRIIETAASLEVYSQHYLEWTSLAYQVVGWDWIAC